MAQQRKEIKSRLHEIASKLLINITQAMIRCYSLAVNLLMCSIRALSVMPGTKYSSLRKHILQLAMVIKLG